MGFSFMEAFMDQVEVISKQGEGTDQDYNGDKKRIAGIRCERH